MLSDGNYGIVETVKPIHYDKPQTTYNFEVADVHTYYVGNGVLVHNMNGVDCGGKKLHKEVADEMGYKKVQGQYSHGEPIYTNSNASKPLKYISADVDSHNGGFWKAASSVKNLSSKATRSGTYDMYLTRRIGP